MEFPYEFRPVIATVPRTFTCRYRGSLEAFHNRIACATPDGDGRYTLVLWDRRAGDPNRLLDVRAQSIETGCVTVWLDSPCICRCGAEHDRTAGLR